MNPDIIESIGDELYAALTERRTIEPLTNTYADITIEDAYQISLRLLANRTQAGERVIGKKIGVTSEAVMNARCAPTRLWLPDQRHAP